MPLSRTLPLILTASDSGSDVSRGTLTTAFSRGHCVATGDTLGCSCFKCVCTPTDDIAAGDRGAVYVPVMLRASETSSVVVDVSIMLLERVEAAELRVNGVSAVIVSVANIDRSDLFTEGCRIICLSEVSSSGSSRISVAHGRIRRITHAVDLQYELCAPLRPAIAIEDVRS